MINFEKPLLSLNYIEYTITDTLQFAKNILDNYEDIKHTISQCKQAYHEKKKNKVLYYYNASLC